MIKKFGAFLNEGKKISKRYLDGFAEYSKSFLEELKKELEGKTVFIKGNKITKRKDRASNTIFLLSCYHVTVKTVYSEGYVRIGKEQSSVFFIIDENDQCYKLKEIITEDEYNKCKEEEKIRKAETAEKKRKEIERKEKIRIFDPYEEEDWGEDFSEPEEKPKPVKKKKHLSGISLIRQSENN